MSQKLMTRKQVNDRYSLSYCAESYRRWEKAGRLTPIKANGRSSRVYYRESEIIALFD
jgi:hypothetical protein